MPATEQKIPLSYETVILLNVKPSESAASYKRVGEGIESFVGTQNPQVSTKQYIHEINASSAITSLQKQFAYSGERVIGDDAFRRRYTGDQRHDLCQRRPDRGHIRCRHRHIHTGRSRVN